MKSFLPIWTALFVLSSALVGCSGSSSPTGYSQTTATEQLAFGVRMAQRGLWSEAMFRFNQAHRLDPNNGRAINNLAVAHEALGNFDEALKFYQEALNRDPGNRDLKQNYARFTEFYQSYTQDDDKSDADAG